MLVLHPLNYDIRYLEIKFLPYMEIQSILRTGECLVGEKVPCKISLNQMKDYSGLTLQLQGREDV